ncbi:MAG: hypothetical protein RMJ43_11745 [Chloroherpetonaceae bacterium]|nr:hypothetical protein [Chthonomonadaceae bacterium]MDW8208501.1 hypothetical protein [Chloroherpetonaceae bacterium]
MPELDEQQKKWIDEMIRKHGLNEYGDPVGTVYAGGNPLFDMATGKMKDRYEYILERHRDWLPQKK